MSMDVGEMATLESDVHAGVEKTLMMDVGKKEQRTEEKDNASCFYASCFHRIWVVY